jgi:Ca2+-binding RTX toxin-like protein
MNDDFRQLTYKLTALLEMLFNSDLYARPVGGSDENFLERLIRHQEGVVADSERGVTAVAADDMLTRFTDDLTMIAQEGGLTMNENIAKALTAFAMQMYYDDNNPNSTDASKKLFDDDSVTGGVHFKPSDLAAPLETTKGYKLYFKHYLNFLPGAEINLAALTAVEGKLPKLIDWYIQAGTSPMNATAGSDPVFMLGGTGNDTLTGGSDDDVLIGGQGIDHLNGGSGNDLLIGGSDGDIIEGGSGNNTLYGGYSNDHLFGGKDNDVIFGGGGNDVIYAGGGFNSLNDESGHDTYKLVSSGIDTIGDSDGKGSVYLNNVQLIGGKKIRECVYTNGGNTYIWSGIEGTPLIINRSKIISNFHNEKKD